MQTFDIVVFGATSFVGKIMVRYMMDTFPKHDKAPTWAIAGRSEAKLQALKDELGEHGQSLPTIVADAANEEQLNAMCEQASVIVSTVGPYALYGEPLIKACVSSGTDYCDLTGEPQWIARMLKRYEKIAQISGSRIVHCCGFDSIPSDLGVWYTQQQAKTAFDESCNKIFMRVRAMKGAASGGTVASMMNLVKEATTDKDLRRMLANPYALCPAEHPFKVRQENLKMARYDENCQSWIAPFIMAAINTRVVHRSNAMQNNAYGEDFVYDEAMLMGKGASGSIKAGALSTGLGGFMVAAALPPMRWVMENTFLPKPGEGPSEKEQLEGFYDLRFFAQTATGNKLQCKVTGDRDPGYGSTGKMLAESAACLALDIDKNERKGGFWTPASAMAEPLLVRLEKYAGLTFSVVE